MNDRTAKLRRESLDAAPSISGERARLLTEFYQANHGRYSVPVMRARAFHYLCEHKTLYFGEGRTDCRRARASSEGGADVSRAELSQPRGPQILNSRPKTWYRVEDETLRLYEEKVIPYWRGRSMRDRMFAELPQDWQDAYRAGIYTEFMEQRAPGHTVLDDKIYSKGMLDFKADIRRAVASLDFLNDAEAYEKREALKSFDISCDARHSVRGTPRGPGPGTGRQGSPAAAARRAAQDRRGVQSCARASAAGFP